MIVLTAAASFAGAWMLSPLAVGAAPDRLTVVGSTSSAGPSPGRAATEPGGSGASSAGAPATSGREPPSGAPATSGTSAVGEGTLYVHVSGAVATPGLVQVPGGSRVFDAVAKAGGVTPEALESGVNLARFVVDGEQILVPVAAPADGTVNSSAGTAGAPAAPAAAAASPAAGTAAGPGTVGPAGKVNLNTANAAQLETLPRVGPAMAAKILAWRTENGAFTVIDDLREVDGIGDKTFDALEPLVTL